jgi:predicted ribosome quality control (RQC) complex YloA/Tae2 family protein
MVLRFEDKLPLMGRKKITRPLSLFIKSRFLGRRLKSVHADLKRGRVLVFSFLRSASEESQDPIEIEARLFPHGQNIIARDGNSMVAELKPKDLPPSVHPDGIEEPRSWDDIRSLWLQLKRARTMSGGGVPDSARESDRRVEKAIEKAIEKKKKAIERMNHELIEKTSTGYRDVGEWLKEHQSLDVPDIWKDLIDPTKGLAWNIEESFRRSKENLRKSEGTRKRIEAVQTELDDLLRQLNEEDSKSTLSPKSRASVFAGGVDHHEKPSKENLLSRAEARGRRHKVGADLEIYIGKSAADNLALLRRAQPFDYWLHLRDQPGSHAILRRTRGRVVTDSELIQAGKWVVEQSLGKRSHQLKGEKHDLLIVECRYVRPIKGDRLGRVNYSNDRVITIRFD